MEDHTGRAILFAPSILGCNGESAWLNYRDNLPHQLIQIEYSPKLPEERPRGGSALVFGQARPRFETNTGAESLLPAEKADRSRFLRLVVRLD